MAADLAPAVCAGLGLARGVGHVPLPAGLRWGFPERRRLLRASSRIAGTVTRSQPRPQLAPRCLPGLHEDGQRICVVPEGVTVHAAGLCLLPFARSHVEHALETVAGLSARSCCSALPSDSAPCMAVSLVPLPVSRIDPTSRESHARRGDSRSVIPIERVPVGNTRQTHI
eukprot:scaffold10292_cov103-Isochrysis_galbana.AAC.1